ncbi:MAG: hypothetical protein NZ959_01995 [Armatimonadetes bacterium]|nr:hypothetical protein [Armatimonadota bacterium]MDW8120832.1 hypothetical protein [Armatimonadota bacterium]
MKKAWVGVIAVVIIILCVGYLVKTFVLPPPQPPADPNAPRAGHAAPLLE